MVTIYLRMQLPAFFSDPGLKCTCKPGSVSTGITHVNGDHLSKNAVTRILQRPTRESKTNRTVRQLRKGSGDPFQQPVLPYLALLPVGFTLPVRLPETAVRSYRTISPLPVTLSPLV